MWVGNVCQFMEKQQNTIDYNYFLHIFWTTNLKIYKRYLWCWWYVYNAKFVIDLGMLVPISEVT
jgi:hypothetical protein